MPEILFPLVPPDKITPGIFNSGFSEDIAFIDTHYEAKKVRPHSTCSLSFFVIPPYYCFTKSNVLVLLISSPILMI